MFWSSRKKVASQASAATSKVAKGAKAAKDAAASVDFSQLSERAQDIAERTRDWAAPRAQQAWKETVKVAAPKIEAASEAVRPRVDAAHEKLVEDYLPRVQRAMHEAAEAAQGDGTLRDRASRVAEATSSALKQPVKKGHPILKGLGYTLLAAVVGAAGYVLWRRSQPVEDPWAEEYWADLEAKTNDVDFEAEAAKAEAEGEDAIAKMDLKEPKEKAEEVAKDAKDKAKEVAEDAKDKAKEVAEDAKDKAKDAKNKAKDLAEDAKDGAKDAMDKAKDAVEDVKEKFNK